jgi:hypothetical protein
VGRGAVVFYGLLAALPVLAIAMVMGGVTGGEFWRVALALASVMFMSLGVGLGVSATGRSEQWVMGMTFGVVLMLNAGVPLVVAGLPRLGWAIDLGWVWVFSPAHTCFSAFDRVYQAGAAGFWRGLMAMQVFGWGGLIWACGVLPRVWREGEARVEKPVRSGGMNRWLGGGETRGGPGRIVGNPVTWWMRRTVLMSPGLMWVLLMGVLGVLVLVDLGGGSGGAHPYVWAREGYGLCLRVLVVFQAGRFLIESRRNGSLELLLSTPLTPREVVDGQAAAVRSRFLGPALVGVAVSLMPVVLELYLWSAWGWGVRGARTVGIHWLVTVGVSAYEAVLLVADLYAAAWLSMMLSLTCRRPGRAPAWALLLGVLLPYVLFCVPRLLIDLPIIFMAQDRLRRQFRSMARRSWEGERAPRVTGRLVPPPLPAGDHPRYTP